MEIDTKKVGIATNTPILGMRSYGLVLIIESYGEFLEVMPPVFDRYKGKNGTKYISINGIYFKDGRPSIGITIPNIVAFKLYKFENKLI